MQKENSLKIEKELVLIGGGHSHLAVLKMFGMQPLPTARITVITSDVDTPYSGMLPGYIAGHYSFDDSHIDLRPLCNYAHARLFHSRAIGLDLKEQKVICADRPPVPFDVLSINTGSTPSLLQVVDDAHHVIPVKPVDQFLTHWDEVVNKVIGRNGNYIVTVVGGGAGGVELVLCTQYRLQKVLQQNKIPLNKLTFYLVTRSTQVMPAHNIFVQNKFARVLTQRGIQLRVGCEASVEKNNQVRLSTGELLHSDAIFWVTDASPQSWYKESGLDVDELGFIRVNDCLQSTSHTNVFAAGDVANVINYPRPKSGVFAVRQGPPLYKNLRRALRELSLIAFRPQRKFLSLVSTGDRYAIASRSWWSLEGAWVWRVKDYIDRAFMRKYSELAGMHPGEALTQQSSTDSSAIQEISAIAMRCGGCGAKIGADVLSRVVKQLQPISREDVVMGLQQPDDAAVTKMPPGKLLVQSVDYFRSFIDDPYIFGKIATHHCLGDIFAMGAVPQSAMAIATIPYASEANVEQQLFQLMSGTVDVLNACGAALVGGHSSEGAELAVGLSITGVIDEQQLLRKGGMQIGDALILTKALGAGTLFAADMRGKAKGRWIEQAIESMLLSNLQAAIILHKYNVHACTDVTGFGVLGHLVEMIRASNVDVIVDLNAIPILDGALETVANGIFSSLQPENIRLRRAIKNINEGSKHAAYALLFDPQTSGGLLASVPPTQVQQCVQDLLQAGYRQTNVIGEVIAPTQQAESILLQI